MNKILITLLLLALNFIGYAQPPKIHFQYDDAGNQIVREWCSTCADRSETPKEIADLKEEDLQTFFPGDVISYYPNPVKEELYLKWELIDDNKVSNIEVYSINGKLVKSYRNLTMLKDQLIPFQEYPIGIYSVVLFYTNGEQKTIKIIKK